MTICINCNTQNPTNNLFCENCGSDLLLEGRYRATHQLGAGGFGATYEVSDQGTAKVLKVLRNNSDTAIRLFQREAKFLASNNYPGIPKAEDNSYFQFQPKNSQQAIHCLVMEKIEGVNLKEYIKQSGKPIKGDLGLRWLKEIIEILDRVHSQDIIHRDIKPQNIMLQPDGKLVLIDFGAVTDEGIVNEGTQTATATSGTETATHTADGTRIFSKGYAAPEQIEGKAIKQSDIYSLGRTFVYLLTAKEPNDPVIYDVFNDQVNWRSHSQGVSPQFADLIDTMIQRIPAQRPANTQIILQKLQQVGGVPKRGEDIEVQTEISEVEAVAGTSNNKKSGCIKPLLWGTLGLAGISAALFIISNANSPNYQYPIVGYPKDDCGTGSGYRVFIPYTEDNLIRVKRDFCKDAFPSNIKSNSDGSKMIQVASFRNAEEAQSLESILQKHFGRVENQTVN